MQFIGRILLLAAVALPLPALAQDAAKPAKSAQDCADELLRNKEAIAAGGETPQEFFHRCWWDSVPGQPTPIKTPGATWNPGHGHPASKGAASKITAESGKTPEHRKAAEAKLASEPKKAAEKPSTEQPAVSRKVVESKPLAEPKAGVGPKVGTPLKPVTAAKSEVPARSDTAIKALVVPEAVSPKQTAASKSAGALKRTVEPKKTAGAADTGAPVSATAKPAAAKPARVERASGPPVGAEAFAAKSHAARERSKRIAAHRPRHEAIAPRLVMHTPPVRLRRHAEARPPYPGMSREVRATGGPMPLVGDRRPGRLARGAAVCFYSAPDARGRSSCVPMSFGLP